MCGICGFITKKNIELNTLKFMNNYMTHRGPNDSGEDLFIINNNLIGLGHRRLSIMDLSDLGHQPMHSPDGRISIVFNGEIYNFQDLKNKLSDYAFSSNCDTEVIIAAYLKWGISCVHHFNGMFAMAIFDKETNYLYLVRDRVGKKPLYYWVNDGDFVFASECKPIIAYPHFQKEIDYSVLNYYMTNEYIPAPNSIYKNMFKIEPGSILEFNISNHKISKYKYWDTLEISNKEHKNTLFDYNQALKKLDYILNDAVKKRMIADVPVGVFLSGGIDSSVVAAIARGYSESKLKTFSIGFSEAAYNEANYSKSVAEYLGTEHNEAYITSDEAVSLIKDIPKYYDEPFADRSQVPAMLVSMLAKKQVDVALTGDGADEFFCGYTSKYTNILYAQLFNRIGEFLYNLENSSIANFVNLERILPRKMTLLMNNRDHRYRTQFSTDNIINFVKNMVSIDGGEYKFNGERYLRNNWQEEAMLIDQVTYLPSVLCKVDRASMRFSLECRSPFLDYRILELSYRMPHSFKYNKDCHGKRILRDLAYSYIPKQLLDRPKQGFGAPVEVWLKRELSKQLEDYLDSSYLIKQGIFNPQYTQKLILNYLRSTNTNRESIIMTPLVWRYFVFQQWYSVYMI